MYHFLLIILFLTGIFKNHLILACLLFIAFTVFLHFIGVSTYQIIFLFALFWYWFENKQRKIICMFIGGLILFFPFLKTSFIQIIYGQPVSYDIPHPLNAETTLLSETKEQEFTRGKYTIKFIPRVQINLSARVVYVQYNDFFDYYSHPVYDTVSPLDVSVFIKSMADNWKEFKVEHEKRGMLVWGNFSIGEYKNLHIIPSNESIYKGFSTVRRGDIVIIKGYLIDWRGTDEFSYLKMKTARNFKTISDEKSGGRITGLCMQFFVTELYANGYLFK